MNIRVSDFCHFVDGKNGLVALYNSLTLGVVIVDRRISDFLKASKSGAIFSEEVERISQQENDLMEQLLKHKIVFPLGSRPDLEDYAKIQQGLGCKNIGILYLLLSDACNLDCTYCFLENAMPAGYHHSLMTNEVARNGIDLFVKAIRQSFGIKEPQIIFYGGEPLMNFTVFSQAIRYITDLKMAGQLPLNTSVTLNTNGTLINERMISVFKETENLNIAISLDGPLEVHDRCRKYHGGQGTFNDIMRGYRLLKEHGIGVGFCCTISRYNVDCLQEIAKWFVDNLGASSVGFNILIENNGTSDVMGDFNEYVAKAARQIIECFKFFRERGVYEDRIMRKVNAFVDGCVYYHDCGGCGQQLVVSPDGMVGVCQGYCGTKKYFVKPEDNFDPFNHPIWNEWSYRSPLAMKQCRDCIALSVCGGGCPYSADLRRGSIWELDEVFCAHAKATIEFLLQDLIEKAVSKTGAV